MRVGLVLGAGGVVGASWLIGALEAVESETGWQPTSAQRIVGTSAGSVVATLTASGIDPALMAAYSAGDVVDDVEQLAAAREDAERFRLQRALPPLGPGSLRMALGTLRHPTRHAPAALLTGWFPRGVVSTAPISALVDRFVDPTLNWPSHDGLRIIACDYGSGRRIAFGSEEAPRADIRQAVAASCAIPGFYHPVRIAGRRYVDGGVCSTSNLDVLAGEDLDVVVCLNPTSSRARMAARSPMGVLAGAMRTASGKRLGHEVRKLRAQGTKVVVIQPTAEDLAAMGHNLMARDRRASVTEQAARSTSRILRELRRSNELPALTGRRPRRGPAMRAAA